MTDRIITGRTFVDQWIVVDGKVFTSCGFERCVLDLRGEESATMTDCEYADCDFIGIWPPGFDRAHPEPVKPKREVEVRAAISRRIIADARARLAGTGEKRSFPMPPVVTPELPPLWVMRLLDRRARRG